MSPSCFLVRNQKGKTRMIKNTLLEPEQEELIITFVEATRIVLPENRRLFLNSDY
jgi:hypothetical protein